MKQTTILMMIMLFAFAANASKQRQHGAKLAKQVSSGVKQKKESHFADKVAFLGSIISNAVLSESLKNSQTER